MTSYKHKQQHSSISFIPVNWDVHEFATLASATTKGGNQLELGTFFVAMTTIQQSTGNFFVVKEFVAMTMDGKPDGSLVFWCTSFNLV